MIDSKFSVGIEDHPHLRRQCRDAAIMKASFVVGPSFQWTPADALSP
ncbi:MAG: hypothetical protein R3F11_19540 [Verrucomicrobiales bacterium]